MKWIKLKDQKPKRGQLCLFYHDHSLRENPLTRKPFGWSFSLGCHETISSDVTHWMDVTPPKIKRKK